MILRLLLLTALLPLAARAAPRGTAPPDSAQIAGYLHGDLVHGDLVHGDRTLSGAAASGWAWEEAPAAKRSVPLAFVLSAAMPGAGQAYNRSWVRAAVYAGLEVALWTGYVTWRGQGLDGERAFQAEAHRQWSPERYGAWLLGYDGFGGDAAALGDALAGVRGVDFQNPDAWSTAEKTAVRTLIGAIRDAENASQYVATGAVFSHVLPFFGEQQYYELIGKYVQFNPGWSDWAGQDLPLTPAGATPQFLAYAEDHREANDLLRRASRVTAVVAVNHVLSAFDAMLTARVHNLRLESRVALAPDVRGGMAPVASLRLHF